MLPLKREAGAVPAVSELPLQVEVFNLAKEPQFSERYVQEMNFPAKE